MKIGFIGLGIMGSRMAANLQKKGHELVVHNRTKDRAKPLLDQGAAWADSPAEVGKRVNILFTMLSKPTPSPRWRCSASTRSSRPSCRTRSGWTAAP